MEFFLGFDFLEFFCEFLFTQGKKFFLQKFITSGGILTSAKVYCHKQKILVINKLQSN